VRGSAAPRQRDRERGTAAHSVRRSGHANLGGTEHGGTVTQEVGFAPVENGDTLPRMAAHARLAALAPAAAAQLAETYQLVTGQTSCVPVHARDADAKLPDVPVLRKVPQVLAAGWGGLGRVCCDASPAASGVLFSRLSLGDAESVAPSPRSRPSQLEQLRKIRHPTRSALIRAYLNADEADSAAGQPQPPASCAGPSWSLAVFVQALNARHPDDDAVALELGTVADLVALGLDDDLADELLALAVDDTTEQDIVLTFLACLLAHDAGADLSRHVRRLIRRATKGSLAPERRRQYIADRLDACWTPDAAPLTRRGGIACRRGRFGVQSSGIAARNRDRDR
jgi:Ca-activated chloride channel family protein